MTTVIDTLSAERPWRTRGELLAARAAAVPALEARLYAAHRLAGQTGLVLLIAFACLVMGQALTEDGAITVTLFVFASAVGVPAVVVAVRMGMQNRALMAQVLAWETAERNGRSLPAGDVRPEHRTPFDARRDADFSAVAGEAGTEAYVRPWRLGLLIRACVVGMWIGLGLILTLGGAVTLPEPFGVGALAGGVVVFAGGLVSGAGATRYSFRLTRLSARLERDLRELASDRPAGEGQPLTPGRRALMLAPVPLPLLVFLLIRIGDASTVALAVTGGILTVAAVVTAAVLLVRSRRSTGSSSQG